MLRFQDRQVDRTSGSLPVAERARSRGNTLYIDLIQVSLASNVLWIILALLSVVLLVSSIVSLYKRFVLITFVGCIECYTECLKFKFILNLSGEDKHASVESTLWLRQSLVPTGVHSIDLLDPLGLICFHYILIHLEFSIRLF